LYLKIDVSDDGSLRGEWGEYFCFGSVGAFGINTFSCRFGGKSERVSGRFGPGRQGVIDLGRLGRSAFSWAAPAVDELAIDLPKNWQGGDAILYRARLTRDGKGKPATTTPLAGDAGRCYRPTRSTASSTRTQRLHLDVTLAERWFSKGGEVP
jgi:hypothetical protein